MTRYRVTVRRSSTLEFDVEVEARSRAEALRLGEDPGEWQVEPDYERLLGDEEVDDIRAIEAERIEEGENE